MNEPSTTIQGWRGGRRSVMPRPMRSTPPAGGFFLVAPIIIGFLWGLPGDRAMQGAVIGLAVGLVLALAFWLIERMRRR